MSPDTLRALEGAQLARPRTPLLSYDAAIFFVTSSRSTSRRRMNLDKLKEAARKFEQREEWRRAIDVYLQAIREAEDRGGEGTQDPGLYNRVGDLELKAGDSPAALRAYEQAAELYAEQGFFNNAIALCGKILRVNPSRTATYLRLAQLHARKNFVGEAKKNLLEYLDRMNGVGQLEEAFSAVKLFADEFHANPDIRLMLVELLRASSRTEEAKEQLEKLATELEARGDATGARRTRERLHEIDVVEPEPGQRRTSSELIFLDTSSDVSPARGTPAPPAPVEVGGLARPRRGRCRGRGPRHRNPDQCGARRRPRLGGRSKALRGTRSHHRGLGGPGGGRSHRQYAP